MFKLWPLYFICLTGMALLSQSALAGKLYIEANWSEFSKSDMAKPIHLRGKVVIRNEKGLMMQADEVWLYQGKGRPIQSLEASGKPVLFNFKEPSGGTQDTPFLIQAKAFHILYDIPRHRLTLTKRASIDYNQNRIEAPTILFDLRTQNIESYSSALKPHHTPHRKSTDQKSSGGANTPKAGSDEQKDSRVQFIIPTAPSTPS